MIQTILIVDNNREDVEHLERLLAGAGYDTRSAASGAEALAAVKRDKPDAILMDVNMPGLDYFGATLALRADPGTKDIPVVLVSAKDRKADKAFARRLGAKGYVIKPFTDAQLLSQVRAL